MANITSKAKEWPKAFYEGGGGSYGFLNPNKIQTGVLQGTLQAGVGGPIFGNGQIVIPQTSGAPIVISGGGITGISSGGPLLSVIITAPSVNVTTAHAPGDTIGGSNFIATSIPHELTSVPAMQCYVQDLYAPPYASAEWRPWNNSAPTLTPNDIGIIDWGILGFPFYLVPAQGTADASFAPNMDAALDCWYITANVNATTIDVFGAAYSGGSTTNYSTPTRAFVLNFYALLGSNVLNFS